jgi:hypothetical protein
MRKRQTGYRGRTKGQGESLHVLHSLDQRSDGQVYGLVSFLTRNATAAIPPSFVVQYGTAFDTSFLVPTDIFAGFDTGSDLTNSGTGINDLAGEAGMHFESPLFNGGLERNVLTDDFHLFDGGGLFDPAWFETDLSDILGQHGQRS